MYGTSKTALHAMTKSELVDFTAIVIGHYNESVRENEILKNLLHRQTEGERAQARAGRGNR
jgi:hypothetical protein